MSFLFFFSVYQVKSNNYPTVEGISYLEAKHLLLLNYCQSLVYYLLRKARGFSINGHPVVQSLVEIRLFLEKVWRLGICFSFSCHSGNLRNQSLISSHPFGCKRFDPLTRSYSTKSRSSPRLLQAQLRMYSQVERNHKRVCLSKQTIC